MLRIACLLLCLVPILAGAAGLTLAHLPPIQFKELLDGLAPDGIATSYNVARAVRMQERLVPAAIAWIVLGIAGLVLLKLYGRQLRIGMSELLGLRRPVLARLAATDRLDRIHIGIVFAMMVGFAVVGSSQLGFSMRCDEGGMYVKYASQPWYFIAATYDRPNNHILHTLFVHFAAQLFGNEPWAIRLPSLFAGILLLPLYYWFVRTQYSRSAALLATVLIATSTWMIDQSVSARGYTMMFCAFVTMCAFLPRLVKLHRWTWFSLVVLLTLGFYVVPIMLYPAAIIGFWMLLSGALDVRRDRKPRYFLKVGIVYVAAAILTIALYSPAMVAGDFRGAVQNQMGHGRHAVMFSQIADLDWRVQTFWESTTHGWPDWLAVLILVGLGLGVVTSRRVGLFGNRLLLSTVLGMASVLLVTGINPPPWTLGFMLPLVLAFSAAGLVGALEWLQRISRSRRWVDGGVLAASLVLAIGIGAHVYGAIRLDRVPWLVGYPDAAEAAAFLEAPLRGGAKVDLGESTPSSIRYYLDRAGLLEPDPFSWPAGRPPSEVYLVDTGRGEYGTQVSHYEAMGLTDVEIVKVLENSRIVRLSRPRGS